MGKRLYDRGETMAGDGNTTPAESRARHHASTSQLNSKSGSIHSSGGGGSNVHLFKACVAWRLHGCVPHRIVVPDGLWMLVMTSAWRFSRGLRHLRLHLVVLFGTKEDSICLDWLESAAKLAGSRLKVWVNLKQGKPVRAGVVATTPNAMCSHRVACTSNGLRVASTGLSGRFKRAICARY